jgi:hypothetical protein
LEKIGEGAFGIVLRAFDEKLHRMVAIKVLVPAFANNATARKRFIREARAAAALKNQHVVSIYEVQEQADPPYLVMELIEGISLQDKLDKFGPMAVTEILRIGLQTAEGLAAAHKQGLVHRDIKPANVLLENGVERVKITDFGLARAVDDVSVTQSGTVAGTPLYMSPEQAEGLALDHRSDLFSLGTLLYVMCTGHPPFLARSTHAVLKRVIEDLPRPIRELNAELPEWLEALIAKLHAKDPGERFQTATEVAELLENHLAQTQRPDQAPPAYAKASPKRGGNATQEKVLPVTEEPPRRAHRGLRHLGLAALMFVLFFSAFWLGHPVARYLSNRAEVEIGPQQGLVGVIVLQNDARVTDWLDMGTSHTIPLSPGTYQLNGSCKPGYSYDGMVWELTTAGLFGDQTVRKSGPGCKVELQRGEHLTVCARPREQPATQPLPGMTNRRKG